jgi:hypothetical protein
MEHFDSVILEEFGINKNGYGFFRSQDQRIRELIKEQKELEDFVRLIEDSLEDWRDCVMRNSPLIKIAENRYIVERVLGNIKGNALDILTELAVMRK